MLVGKENRLRQISLCSSYSANYALRVVVGDISVKEQEGVGGGGGAFLLRNFALLKSRGTFTSNSLHIPIIYYVTYLPCSTLM